MRSISRVADVSVNTVTKLLEDAGRACAAHHEATVTGVKAKRVQCDELWSSCYTKERNVETAKAAPEDAGDVWTWTALDADSQLIVAYLVGGRDAGYAHEFMQGVASRLSSRVQLATDGLKAYLDAVEGPFGADVDFAQLVKIYGEAPVPASRYSPGICTGAVMRHVEGRPDTKHVSTSYVERQNLTMRMSMRRFTGLTNAFSKKAENQAAALALYFTLYNFVWMHKSLRCSPAVAAGVSDRVWSMENVAALVVAAKGPAKERGPYKAREPKTP